MSNKVYITYDPGYEFAHQFYSAPQDWNVGTRINFDMASGPGWSGLPPNSGWVSARADLGTGVKAQNYEWRFFSIQTPNGPTATIGQQVELYVATDSILPTGSNGNLGSNTWVSGSKINNLTYLGSVNVDGNNKESLYSSGFVKLGAVRYVSLVVFNKTSALIGSGVNSYRAKLIPIVQEIQ